MKDDRICLDPGCGKPYSSKGYCKVHAERMRRRGTTELTGYKTPRTSIAERLWAKVDSSGGPDACWPWLGALTEQGYGRIRTGGQGEPSIGVHRAAWMNANPDAASPESIDHLCHDPDVCRGGPTCPHRRCCNPAHLIASTVQDNSRPDRQWTKRRLTHCSHGHEYTEDNTHWFKGRRGRLVRRCRRCDAEAHQAARDRRVAS